MISLRPLLLTIAATSALFAAAAASAEAHNQPPSASIAWAPQTPRTGDDLVLSGSAVDPEKKPVTLRWDLDGDGTYETVGATAPAHFSRGDHTVALLATDADRASTVVTRTITVANAGPSSASFTWGSGSPRTGEDVTLTGTGSDPEGDALTYRWDLDGDGSYETAGEQVTTSFTRGDRSVALQVADPDGATREVSRTISVANSAPFGDFGWAPDAPLSNTTVHLTTGGVDDLDDGPSAVTAGWDLDDDGTVDAQGLSADTTFTTPGSHTVALHLTDPQGASVVVRHAVSVVNRPPVASIDAGPVGPAPGQEVLFTAHASDPDAGTMQLKLAWDLDGDGAYDDGGDATARRAYDAGTHVVRVRVTDGSGDTFTAERTIVVSALRTLDDALVATDSSSAAAPLLQPVAMNPFPVVRLRGRATRRGVVVELLRITNVPAGARISATCRGKGCGDLTRALAKSGRNAGRLVKAVTRGELRPGAVLEIRITRPGSIGKLTRFTIRRGRAPLRYDGCLTPAGKAGPCA